MNTTVDLAHRLVDLAASEQMINLDDAAREATKTFILDSLGVGISGSREAFAGPLLKLCQQWGRADDARVLGTGERLAAPAAALINGWQIHNQEFDCVHEPAVVHPMATVLSALLAWADRQGGVSGRDFMAAVNAAVDVATLLGMGARSSLSFFRPAVCGGLGASLGMARLAGLDREGMLDALGLAYSQAAGTMQAHVEGSPTLAMQIAFNSRNALVAVDLAAAGLNGPHNVIEGPYGFYKLFEPESDVDALLPEFQRRQITQVSHKPFPSGRASHAGLDAVARLLNEESFSAEDIVAVRLEAPPLIARLVGRKAKVGMSESHARLCFGYTAACLVLDGALGPTTFDDEYLNDPTRVELANRCDIVVNHVQDPNAMIPQRLTLTLRDGREFTREMPAVLGSPELPLTREQHLDKFRACCEAAARPLPAVQIDDLIAAVDELEQLDDVRTLIDLCVSGGSTT